MKPRLILPLFLLTLVAPDPLPVAAKELEGRDVRVALERPGHRRLGARAGERGATRVHLRLRITRIRFFPDGMDIQRLFPARHA